MGEHCKTFSHVGFFVVGHTPAPPLAIGAITILNIKSLSSVVAIQKSRGLPYNDPRMIQVIDNSRQGAW